MVPALRCHTSVVPEQYRQWVRNRARPLAMPHTFTA
jgi:hypothetical protein